MAFSLDQVRRAWEAESRRRRGADGMAKGDPFAAMPSTWVREVFSSFIIIEEETAEGGLRKVPFTVSPEGRVLFGQEVPVVVSYTEVSDVGVALSNGLEGHLVELAMVKGHTRKTKHGVVNVDSYWRAAPASELVAGMVVKDSYGKVKTVQSVVGRTATFTDGTRGTGRFRISPESDRKLGGAVKEKASAKPARAATSSEVPVPAEKPSKKAAPGKLSPADRKKIRAMVRKGNQAPAIKAWARTVGLDLDLVDGFLQRILGDSVALARESEDDLLMLAGVEVRRGN